jgi:hypothetical protein
MESVPFLSLDVWFKILSSHSQADPSDTFLSLAVSPVSALMGMDWLM